ncbi:MAG: hypothetical protein GY804_03780 [Alphaproteobacteria bacterium]|nr:hypothetical protein [Alphaproteobacteria bacterium]
MELPKYTMLFPNKVNPDAYRVQCKLLKLNRYFYFKEYGSEKNALLAATDFSESVIDCLKAKRLKEALLINVLFDGNSIRGLSINNKKRTNHYNLVMRTRVNDRLVLVGERSLKVNTPYHAVEDLFMRALEIHDAEFKRDIRTLYLEARPKMVTKILNRCNIL